MKRRRTAPGEVSVEPPPGYYAAVNRVERVALTVDARGTIVTVSAP